MAQNNSVDSDETLQQTTEQANQSIKNVADKAKTTAKNVEKTAKNAKKTANNIAKGIKNIANAVRRIGSGIVNATKAIYSFISSVVSFIASFWWLILIILAVVLIVVVIVVIIVMASSAGINGVYEDGKYTPGAGAIGDKFYGERFIYYDELFSGNEIKNTYLEYSWGSLKNAIDDEVISIPSFAETYTESEDALIIALNFAKSISSLNNSNMEISYYIGGIDHYGLTLTESEQFIDLMKNYIITHNYIKPGKTQVDVYNSLISSLNDDYSYMKNVCKKIIIKDYIFEEDSGIKELEAKKYGGLVFMPKEDVTITDLEFGFIVPQGVEVNATYNCYENGQITEIANATADSSWFVDGIIENSLHIDIADKTIKKFTALDEENIEYLTSGMSLFNLIKNEKINTYFNGLIVGYETTINDLLCNIKTDNYHYLKCQAEGYYIVADVLTEYK